MAYNANIPNANDKVSQSQAQIKENFTLLGPLLNTGTNAVVRLPVQPSAPTTGASTLSLYSKSVSGTPQLFMRQQSNGAEFDFTSSLKAVTGWTRLPSGILMKWGTETGVPINSSSAWTFPTPGGTPAFTSIFSVQLTTGPSTNVDHNQTVILNSFTTLGFNIFVRQLTGAVLGNTSTIYYFAIGI